MQDNKQIYRDFFEQFLSHGDESAADRLVADDVVSHAPMPGQEPGRVGLKQAIAQLRSAFPDLSVRADDLIAEGNKVVGRFVVTGTHTGDFMGMPATARSFSYDEIGIVRIEDGRIVEHWAVMDSLGMMQQLGLM